MRGRGSGRGRRERKGAGARGAEATASCGGASGRQGGRPVSTTSPASTIRYLTTAHRPSQRTSLCTPRTAYAHPYAIGQCTAAEKDLGRGA
eukprot:3941870-Rhodomonas_salina.3